jgi:hypothetical protein
MFKASVLYRISWEKSRPGLSMKKTAQMQLLGGFVATYVCAERGFYYPKIFITPTYVRILKLQVSSYISCAVAFGIRI